MLKKIVAVLCALICMISVTACGNETGGASSFKNETDSASSFDKAVAYYYEGIYEKDVSKWLKIVPKEFIKEHEDVKEKIEYCFSFANPEEILPNGIGSLSYETEDLTQEFEEKSDYNEVQALKSIFKKYGIEDIEGVWHVESNFQNFENDTLIVESDGKYFSTYALGYILYEYGEDTHGLFY